MRLPILLATLECLRTSQAGEVVVGDVRVQALSPTLLRVEPKGPHGFEDRTTFMVADRDFPGVPISRVNDSVLKTSHYTVVLRDGSFSVQDPAGHLLYDAAANKDPAQNLLHWPSPLTAQAYALVDFPRFHTPPWDVAPIPKGATVDPALLQTHGYDFRNDVEGDTYVFLLRTSLAEWHASRAEFLKLTGPVPLLPDFAYGTWFTWWHQYTETEAKQDISRWEADNLPLDVWALDMNWRTTANHTDRYYNHPNTDLFPDFTEWFAYLRKHRLRTYFNDHPFPVASRSAGGLQTSPEETAFRWHGLSEWMDRGLTYWWFDHNWAFSIPPPFVNTSATDGEWHGLDNAAWGSHVYYTSVAHFDSRVRDPAGDPFYGRPMTLTKFAKPDWRPGKDPKGSRESPSHHRYPVWWTGDAVDLQASVESMVDGGVHGLKPFVHSDCGGDKRGSAGALLRWTAHCVFGTVLRFHGSDHRPWTYGPRVEAAILKYLKARYKLLPTLIAAGQEATDTGFPLVARCDLFWPEHAESATNGQYVFLRDVLVAPIWDFSTNITDRSVWIPPGDWQDAWSGSVVTGPKTITASQPYERQPMWHRRGGLLVLAHSEAVRTDEQDWSVLSIEVFPRAGSTVQRSIYERGSGLRTNLTLRTADHSVHLRISEGTPRAWAVRFHLRPGESAAAAHVDGELAPTLHISSNGFDVTPFGGLGSAPAPGAGPVVEVPVGVGSRARVADVRLELERQLVV